MKKGIDVSRHQGRINWSEVASQIDFAILRCGYGNNIKAQDDSTFEYNYTECKKHNIPVGVYLYSYARNTDMALSEAQHVCRLLKGKSLELPVFYDIEDPSQERLSKDIFYNMYRTFHNTVSAQGFNVGLYGSKYWLTSILPTREIEELTSNIWVAQYAPKCTYKGNYIIWQNSNSKYIKGIVGRVDYNYMYDSAFITDSVKEIVNNAEYYTVVKGDNLTKIAKKYNTTVSHIQSLNPAIKNPNLIYPNEIIRVR